MAANSEYVIAASALVTPARTIETTIAEPAPTWPASPVIAVPIAAKIPAPMIAPIPSAVSCTGPSVRRIPPPTSLSAMHWSTVFRANSCPLSTESDLPGLWRQSVRNDGHAGDVIDVSSIACGCGIEEISHHPFGEFASIIRVFDRRRDLDARDSSFSRDPDPHIMSPAARLARRAGRRKDRPPRRGGKNATRPATRASARIRARARSRPCAFSAAGARSLSGTAGRSRAGANGGRRQNGNRRWNVDLDRLLKRHGDGGNRHGWVGGQVLRLWRGGRR